MILHHLFLCGASWTHFTSVQRQQSAMSSDHLLAVLAGLPRSRAPSTIHNITVFTSLSYAILPNCARIVSAFCDYQVYYCAVFFYVFSNNLVADFVLPTHFQLFNKASYFKCHMFTGVGYFYSSCLSTTTGWKRRMMLWNLSLSLIYKTCVVLILPQVTRQVASRFMPVTVHVQR